MPKLTEYPQATGFDANDILIKDGVNGTKKITIEDFIEYIGGRASFKNHGYLSNTDNLDDITEMGTYTISGTDSSKPIGYPIEMTGASRPGMLIVFASTVSTNDIIEQVIVVPSLTSTIENDGTTIQAAGANMILYRHRTGSNPITWYSWTSISISRVLISTDDADDILYTGDYRCQTSNRPANLPVTEGGLLMVRAPARDMVSQIYITLNSGIYYRVRISTGWGNWTKFYVPSTPTSIPVLALTGDISGMNKEDSATLNYTFFDRSGTCTVKWQGSSSLRYAKKNYTIKFDEKMDAIVNYTAFRRNFYRTNGVKIESVPFSIYEFSTKNEYKDQASVYYDGKFYRFNNGVTHSPGPWDPSEVTELTNTLSFRPWGDQKKFCAKANWIDPSALRNVVNAKLWGQMVKTRIDNLEVNDGRATAPNYGAIDGFPIFITINGDLIGLFTLNIPKDAWTFAMLSDAPEYDATASYAVGDAVKQNDILYRCNTPISGGETWNSAHWDQVTEYVVGGENNSSPACVWKNNIEMGVNIDWNSVAEYDKNSAYTVGQCVYVGDTLWRCKANTPDPAAADPNVYGELSSTYWDAMFAIEHNTEGTAYKDALQSLDAALTVAKNAGANWETDLAPYVDIESIFDYFIFTLCTANNDALARNILYGSYDGTKWFMSAYDLDTTYGFDPYGNALFEVKGDRTNFKNAASFNKLANLMYTYSKAKLKARYKLWREGGYSGSELTGWTAFTDKKYMKTDVAVGAVVSELTGSSNVRYVKVSCSPGDKFTIVTKGGSASRAWAFVDSEDKLISAAAASTTISVPTVFTAPENAAYFIVNDTLGTGYGYGGVYYPPVLSDENVWLTFSNFGKDISVPCYEAERRVWPDALSTSIATIPQFMDYYRMHCKYLDAEIEALS